MNSQVNNPLYQQFVELVNTTSSGVIEQCVEPLSKTLPVDTKISKIKATIASIIKATVCRYAKILRNDNSSDFRSDHLNL